MAERPTNPGFAGKQEAPYTNATMNERRLEPAPTAPQDHARKSPEICRPVSKRNKPSICGGN